MNPIIVEAVNQQIRLEFESAFLYLAFSGNLRQYGLPGMGHWMREQYREDTRSACGNNSDFRMQNAELKDSALPIGTAWKEKSPESNSGDFVKPCGAIAEQ